MPSLEALLRIRRTMTTVGGQIDAAFGASVYQGMQDLITQAIVLNKTQAKEKKLQAEAVKAAMMLVTLFGDAKGGPVDMKKAKQYMQAFDTAFQNLYALNQSRVQPYKDAMQGKVIPQAAVETAPKPRIPGSKKSG